MPISTVLFESCLGMSRPPAGLVFLNPESCWQKSNFYVDRKAVCEYRYTCNEP